MVIILPLEDFLKYFPGLRFQYYKVGKGSPCIGY